MTGLQKKLKFAITRNHILAILGGLVSFFVMVSAAFFLWVMTGPRSINSFTPYIESALSSPENGYKVKIENSEIEWNEWHNPFGMSARNVEIINNKGTVIAYFPEVLVKIYLYKLLLGKIDIKSLAFISPNAMLIQNDDGSIALGLNNTDGGTNSSIPAILALLTSESSDNPVRHLKLLLIRHATLSIQNKIAGIFLRSSDTSVEITKKHGRIKGSFTVPLMFDNKTSSLSGNFSADKKSDMVTAQIIYKDIATSALHALFPTQEWLKGIHLSVSGAVRIFSNFAADISATDFTLESGQGSIEYPSVLSEPINLQNLEMAGSVTDQMNTLNIASAKASLIGNDSKTINMSLNATIKKTGNDYAIEGHGETANIPVNDVHRYWPLTLSPHSRAWVTTHISNGIITKADVDLHFKPGEIKFKDTPENAIASTIVVKNTDIKYLPKHLPVTDVNAVIKFTGITISRHLSEVFSKRAGSQ